MFERLNYTDLSHTAAAVGRDISALFRSELRLLKAELANKVSEKLHAVIWLGLGGVLAFIALILLLLAVAAGIAALGLDLHWALLIVAVVLACGAGAALAKGITNAKADMTPTRSLTQIRQDIDTAKETLT